LERRDRFSPGGGGGAGLPDESRANYDTICDSPRKIGMGKEQQRRKSTESLGRFKFCFIIDK
jgi:hypothetical protein